MFPFDPGNETKVRPIYCPIELAVTYFLQVDWFKMRTVNARQRAELYNNLFYEGNI